MYDTQFDGIPYFSQEEGAVPARYLSLDILMSLAKGQKDLTLEELAASIDHMRHIVEEYQDYGERIDGTDKQDLFESNEKLQFKQAEDTNRQTLFGDPLSFQHYPHQNWRNLLADSFYQQRLRYKENINLQVLFNNPALLSRYPHFNSLDVKNLRQQLTPDYTGLTSPISSYNNQRKAYLQFGIDKTVHDKWYSWDARLPFQNFRDR